MKTLDEVIKALEYCQNPVDDLGNCKEECPYIHCCDPECTAVKEDALHYLKEYKAKQEDLEQKNDHVCEMAKTICEQYDRLCNRLAEEYRNEPLTWDELRTMTGKPVWVEALLYKQWAIIAYVGDEHIRFEGVNLYAPESRTYMSAEDGWQAYRKERE